MDSIVLLGVLGSVASIVSLLISGSSIKSKLVHAGYGFLLVVVVGATFIFNQEKINDIQIAEHKAEMLENQIKDMNSIKAGATAILESKGNYSTSDVGENRGFILTSFAFMEKHKDEFPESFEIAKKLIIDGLKITQSAGDHYESKRMRDGADAMRKMLQGIAAGKT
ncbi:hypothetical protein [Alteromonas macleodii]|uniref:Uncharacterized protein n=1 Tax=Alteromonas macleodii TaxID=28108 RepID=A0A126Q0U8_ALTMA|nr:hypothetical protein [Alteromonas macleodii]AMJ98805.1 hypothetical protein AVL55_11885 [Alteromonas macleodii]AUI82874.1 hypothetical protein TE101_11480 [Alteromonas macleodii]